MPSLADVNFLFALINDQHSQHTVARQWFGSIEIAGDLAVCRVAQMGLLRLLTNPKAMLSNPLSMKDAWQIYDTLMTDDRLTYLEAEPTRLHAIWRKLTITSMSRNAWTDAYLAAFALAADLAMVTFDRDFKQFANLHTVIPS